MKLAQLQERFNDHVLTKVIETGEVKIFDFKNISGTIVNYQRWIINKGVLIVLGDNYSSVYKWNDTGISLKFLAECNLDYFSSKCLADKDGENQSEYDSVYAEDYLKEIAVETLSSSLFQLSNPNIHFSPDAFEKLDIEKKYEALKPYIVEVSNYDLYDLNNLFSFEMISDAIEFLQNPANENLFGCDGWEYCNGLERKTIVPKLHLAALISAFNRYPVAF